MEIVILLNFVKQTTNFLLIFKNYTISISSLPHDERTIKESYKFPIKKNGWKLFWQNTCNTKYALGLGFFPQKIKFVYLFIKVIIYLPITKRLSFI